MWKHGERDVSDDKRLVSTDSKFCGFYTDKIAVLLFSYYIYVSCSLDSV